MNVDEKLSGNDENTFPVSIKGSLSFNTSDNFMYNNLEFCLP